MFSNYRLSSEGIFSSPQCFNGNNGIFNQMSQESFNQGQYGIFKYGGYQSGIYQQYKRSGIPQINYLQPKCPITIGTSVIGIKFNDGVTIAADNKVSFGMLARYTEVERVFKISDNIIMGAFGNFADFQQIKQLIDRQILEDKCYDDGHHIQPKSLYNWLRNLLHKQRSQLKPLFVNVVIGGIDENGETFLAFIDLRGLGYEVKDVVAIGSSKILAKPVIAEKIKNAKNISIAEASDFLKTGMEVLYYRDTTSMCQFSRATVTKRGSVVEGPFCVDENWKLAKSIRGY